jgi:formylglycine-generating enzyme required for sulfatase activity
LPIVTDDLHGCLNMHGNVAEWVQDCVDMAYLGTPVDGSAATSGDCNANRVLRGGGSASLPGQTRSAFRGSARQRRDFGAVGFRVARAL